ncbi:hypothetical protein AAHE18_19G215900 [Arachis hypogaea]
MPKLLLPLPQSVLNPHLKYYRVSDAMATLAGAEYWDNDVAFAIILGTETNACYVEQIDGIPKLQGGVSSFGKMFDDGLGFDIPSTSYSES